MFRYSKSDSEFGLKYFEIPALYSSAVTFIVQEQLIDEISKRAGSRMLTDKRNTLEYNDVCKYIYLFCGNRLYTFTVLVCV